MNTSISLLVEIPEILHDSLKSYLDMRPDWDQDRAITAALSLFLLQNQAEAAPEKLNHRQASRIYLDSLFKRPIGQN